MTECVYKPRYNPLILAASFAVLATLTAAQVQYMRTGVFLLPGLSLGTILLFGGLPALFSGFVVFGWLRGRPRLIIRPGEVRFLQVLTQAIVVDPHTAGRAHISYKPGSTKPRSMVFFPAGPEALAGARGTADASKKLGEHIEIPLELFMPKYAPVPSEIPDLVNRMHGFASRQPNALENTCLALLEKHLEAKRPRTVIVMDS